MNIFPDIIFPFSYYTYMMRIYRDYLLDNEISQRWLAANVGISTAHMCAIVKGKRHPSPKLAAKIEKITGIPLRRLLLPDEDEPEGKE